MPKELRYVVVLTLIAGGSAGLLATVYEATRGPIAASRKARTLQALQVVLPEFDNVPTDERVVVGAADPAAPTESEANRLPVVYTARKGGRVVGGAVQVIHPRGYGGPVKVLVGLEGDPAGTVKVRGYRFLEHKETPGLGTKALEPPFATQFEGFEVPTGPLKVKKDGGTVDAITGATITSRVVAESIGEAARLFREHGGRGSPATGALASGEAPESAPRGDGEQGPGPGPGGDHE